MQPSIRRNGFIKLLIGLASFVAVTLFVIWLKSQGYTPNSFALIGLGAPVAIGLVGLLEVLMNRPFSEMEGWWNGLQGWQRGLLGLLVVVIAFAIIIGAMVGASTLGLI